MAVEVESRRSFFRRPAPRTPAEWRGAREAAGLGVSQLARRAGVSRDSIWRLETTGRVSERVRRLVAYALDLGPLADAPLPWSEEAS